LLLPALKLGGAVCVSSANLLCFFFSLFFLSLSSTVGISGNFYFYYQSEKLKIKKLKN
jgi:hypothetical protein